MKILRPLLPLALAFVSFASSAQMANLVQPAMLQNGVPVATECNNCSNVQLYNAAIAGPLVGVQYFYDLTLHQITAWQASKEPNGKGGYIYDATQVTVPAPIAAAFANFNNGVVTYGRAAMNSTVTINVNSKMTGFPSALTNVSVYGIIETSAYQNDISDWIMTAGNPQFSTPLATGLNQSVWGVLSSLSSIIFKNDVFSATINVTLSDGSRVTFSWKASTDPTFTSARDVNNNTIPLNLSAFPQNYVFNNDPAGLAAFEAYLQWLGVPVVAGTDLGSIPSVVVECYNKSGNSTLCTVQPN
ncbi:MAG: hypothetical protein P4L92_08360 [Rudaea sp.]|nr:hypothetical protein [Rudaea sp.]